MRLFRFILTVIWSSSESGGFSEVLLFSLIFVGKIEYCPLWKSITVGGKKYIRRDGVLLLCIMFLKHCMLVGNDWKTTPGHVILKAWGSCQTGFGWEPPLLWHHLFSHNFRSQWPPCYVIQCMSVCYSYISKKGLTDQISIFFPAYIQLLEQLSWKG